jgi:GcrA cell cycle regulator
MGWEEEDAELLKKLWASGQSAAQIARRLGHSRGAVCGKLRRLGLKRGHAPPTAKPKIVSRSNRRRQQSLVSVPKREPAQLAACSRPVDRVVSTRKTVARQPKEFTKRQLYAMLAEAVRNTSG